VGRRLLNNAQAAAQKVGISLVPIAARNPWEIEKAFAAFAQERVQAVMVAVDAISSGSVSELPNSRSQTDWRRFLRYANTRGRRADELR
jgi:hypothetical protein